MAEIRKDRKYIVQFPETMDSSAQEEYLTKMEESLKSEDRFTVIDPKIKIYPTEKVDEVVEPTVTETEEPNTETVTETEEPNTETVTETEEPNTETNEETTPSTDEVVIKKETVETTEE